MYEMGLMGGGVRGVRSGRSGRSEVRERGIILRCNG